MFRKIIALLISLFLLVLSSAAIAESDIGLFGKLIDSDCSDDRLAVLDQVAETISVSQTTEDATVEVCQAYYEGNRIFISYRVSGPAMVLDGLDMEDGAYADIIAGGETSPEDGSIFCDVPRDG